MKRKFTFHKELITPVIAVMLTGGLLLTVLISLMKDETFGWFSMNKNVNATGAAVSALTKDAEILIAPGSYADGEWEYGEFVPLSPSTELNLSDFTIPGTAVRFKLRLRNKSDSIPISVTEFGFAEYGDVNEVPVTIDDKDYYLGTQLTACLVSGDPEERTAAQYLASYADGTSGDLTAAAALVLCTDTTEIAAGGTVDWIVELRFVNEDRDQNAYADFGEDGNGVCTRQIYFMVE